MIDPRENNHSKAWRLNLKRLFIFELTHESEERNIHEHSDEVSMPSQPARQILIVDDQNSVCEMIALLLRSRGYAVCTASNGRDALMRLKDTPLQLVISDLTMPRMSGFELISAIRWRFPRMPVIAMSGTYTADQIPKSADAFYAKGRQSPETLLFKVEELLSGSHNNVRKIPPEDAHGRRVA